MDRKMEWWIIDRRWVGGKQFGRFQTALRVSVGQLGMCNNIVFVHAGSS